MFSFLILLEEDQKSCFVLTALIVFLNIYCISCNRLATDSLRDEICSADVPCKDCNAKDLNTVVLVRCNPKPRGGNRIDHLYIKVQTMAGNDSTSSLMSK